MLRNSTKQFRLRYETTSPQPYTANGILALRLSRDGQGDSAKLWPPRLVQSPQRPLARRKLEQSTSTAARSIQVRTKQSIELGHRRQFTAPLQDSEETSAGLASMEWDAGDSTLSRDPKQFLKELPRNSIFFCCKCYQYVFEIEKQRHFPDCKDTLDVAMKYSDSFRKMAWERLERIAELARYTKVKSWEVEELYRQIKDNDFAKIYSVRCPRQCVFLSLEEIVTAFVFTYEELLKGAVFTPAPFFSCQ